MKCSHKIFFSPYPSSDERTCYEFLISRLLPGSTVIYLGYLRSSFQWRVGLYRIKGNSQIVVLKKKLFFVVVGFFGQSSRTCRQVLRVGHGTPIFSYKKRERVCGNCWRKTWTRECVTKDRDDPCRNEWPGNEQLPLVLSKTMRPLLDKSVGMS